MGLQTDRNAAERGALDAPAVATSQEGSVPPAAIQRLMTSCASAGE